MSHDHDFSIDRAVIERIDEVIAEFPDRLAVVAPDRQLRYGELAVESRRIAALLLSHEAASRARRVAIPGHHLGGSIAAILGILRTGKAWVPFDPRDPLARQAERWQHAGQPPILCERGDTAWTRELGAPAPAVVWVPDGGIRGAALETTAPAIDPHDEAYLLYTSGSTGVPKGVVQSQRNLLYHARAYARSLGLGPQDRMALVASLAVDAALMDIFGALTTGASIHLWDTRRNGAEGLADWLDSSAITIYHSTPTLFRFWARELARERSLLKLRRLVLGGESAHREDLQLFRRVCARGAVLVNGLGPTESTLAMQAFFSHDSEIVGDDLPIGHPVAGTEASIHPEDGTDGNDVGELLIRSPHLALGYDRLPELTRAAFLPDPEGGDRRVYRTGDRVRRTTDGSWVFVGRCDARFKLRGYLVEPADIETRLRSYPGIAEAALILAESPSGEPLLAAFVRAERGGVVDETTVLARLREELPPAMAPSRVVRLDAMPLTTSGKLDRQALRKLLERRSERRAPVGPVETRLALAFTEVLSVDEIGADDDFFALGGHSLLALRLLARVHEAFGIALPLTALFETPTVATLAARLEKLVGHLEARATISPAPRDGPLPLSFGQERLLFHDRLAPADPTYHVPAAARLRGAVDATLLERALGHVVGRHEALRATFSIENGTPVQRVGETATVSFEIRELSEIPEKERFAAALAKAREEARRPFDLAKGPLLRAVLFRLAPEDALFLLTAHHIAMDGWSLRQFFAELSTAYAESRQSGGPVASPPPSRLHYPDYAVWQRRTLTGPLFEHLRQQWRERLTGAPALLLPTDRPRPSQPSRRGGCCSFELPAEVERRLRQLAKDSGTTLYMTLLTAYALFLGQHAGQGDFVVASPVAGRAHPDFDDVLGSFINTVPLRLDLSGDPTVRELITRVKRVALDAFAGADLPYDQMVADLATGRDLATAPLAQAMLIVHHGPQAQLCVDGVGVEPYELHLDVAMFDLTLTVRDDQRLHAWFEFARDLFDESTVERFRERWLWIVEELSRDLDAPVSRLQLLPPSERRRLTREFNRTEREYDKSSIHARVLATAERMPEAPAVVCRDDQLSYGELMAWSRSVAGQLIEQGVQPHDVVPVVLGRGIELVPALLGVLDASAAFVPIDGAWPTLRLQGVLARLKPHAVVVDQAHAELPALAGLSRVVVDRSRVGAIPARKACPATSPGGPVYGFFTSGSTGEPKLAMVAHGGLANRFSWMDEWFVDRPIVTLQTTPHMFDSAVWQLLWPLCSGGRVVIPSLPSSTAVLSAAEVTTLIERHGVTVVDFVPSMLDALLPQLTADPHLNQRLASLRDMVVGGEALRPETLRALRRALPNLRLTNLYGPTEATIGCIAAVLMGDEATIPIGRPIANVRAVVLDPRGRLVPVGVPGELYLAGACLGLGYFHDEEATRAAFVKNTVAGLDGETLYRTGDRARVRADGVFEYLGRCDDQLKLRGLRIDPREIESVLRGHPSVREAFVSAWRSPAGEPELAAWVAPQPFSAELRPYLHARLPAALVPTRLIACAELPRGSSGKLDRRALQTIAAPCPSESASLPPRSPTERIIADIWQRLLGIDVMDARKSFFEAGGNSLLALRAHAELMDRLGRPVALVDLFRYPTVADLAAHLDATMDATNDSPTPYPRSRDRT